MSHNPRFIFVVGCLLLGGLPGTTLAQTTYTVTPVLAAGAADNADASGGVNYLGQVAGALQTATGDTHAFFFDPAHGGAKDLGTLGGAFSRANGINDSGVVVGRSTIASGEQHAFEYTSANGMQDIHALVSLGGTESSAIGISGTGVIVGWATVASGDIHAFVYNPSSRKLTDLQPLLSIGGLNSNAFGINNAGQVVGVADTAYGLVHGFSYNPVTGVTVDLGALGGQNSAALSVNSAGLTVGSADADPDGITYHAFEVGPNTTLAPADDIGTFGGLDSTADWVNDSGQVVGSADLANQYTDAFVWDSVNGLRDLNDVIPANSGWILIQGQGISAVGHIAGFGFLKEEQQLFLLTPVTVPGDVNGDGVVNCSDLSIVKLSFGKKVGQPGFDARADVNRDGVVNVLDLSAVARQVPAGTVCQ